MFLLRLSVTKKSSISYNYIMIDSTTIENSNSDKYCWKDVPFSALKGMKTMSFRPIVPTVFPVWEMKVPTSLLSIHENFWGSSPLKKCVNQGRIVPFSESHNFINMSHLPWERTYASVFQRYVLKKRHRNIQREQTCKGLTYFKPSEENIVEKLVSMRHMYVVMWLE